jgi:hypothetical protein
MGCEGCKCIKKCLVEGEHSIDVEDWENPGVCEKQTAGCPCCKRTVLRTDFTGGTYVCHVCHATWTEDEVIKDG